MNALSRIVAKNRQNKAARSGLPVAGGKGKGRTGATKKDARRRAIRLTSFFPDGIMIADAGVERKLKNR